MKPNHRTPFSGGGPFAKAIGKLAASKQPKVLPNESHRRNAPTVRKARNPNKRCQALGPAAPKSNIRRAVSLAGAARRKHRII